MKFGAKPRIWEEQQDSRSKRGTILARYILQTKDALAWFDFQFLCRKKTSTTIDPFRKSILPRELGSNFFQRLA